MALKISNGNDPSSPKYRNDAQLVAGIAGSALNIYGKFQAFTAQIQNANQIANAAEMTANEILERAEINTELIREAEQIAMSDMQARSQGASVESQTILAGMEEIARQASKQIYNLNREARYDAMLKNLEAVEARRNAKDLRKAQGIQAVGDIVMSALNMGSSAPGGR